MIFHNVAGAPDPVAPFSHAVEANGFVFVTGQMPFTGTSNTSPYPEGIAAQTRHVMENLLNRVDAGYFPPGKRPARTCVGVTALARGARVEIDFVAARP